MLHHVSLEVPPDEAERLCEAIELIGFARVAAPEALGDSVLWFERSGTQIHLILTDGATAPVLGHAAFAVDDFEATTSSLQAHGFEFEESRELWGERRGFLLAPGGHRMELIAAPPP